MPYTWGAAVSDSATFASSFGSNDSSMMVTGWFYPTTLTAGRFYLTPANAAATANYGIRVGTTTSTLEFLSCNTTPGLWTATADTTLFPAGITTNTWWYIAVVVSVALIPVVSYRAWIGTLEIPPTPMTIVNNTAPAGLPSSGFLTFGNASGNTLAFQGEIATVTYMVNSIGSSNSPLGIATAGSITNDEAARIESNFVVPIWLGNVPSSQPRDVLSIYGNLVFDFKSGIVQTGLGTSTATRATIVPSGATQSQSEQPRSGNPAWPTVYPLVRR